MTVNSMMRLNDHLEIPIEQQVAKINSCLEAIDQLLIPSTINNLLNQRSVLKNEREIIHIFQDAERRALNYLVMHTKLSLLFYKIKDHRNFGAQHRTMLIELLAVEKLSLLTVISRVIVLHALQVTKLPANAKAEYWVRNIFMETRQDDLSELKTRTDSKGNFFCMNKLIYQDIRSETVRQDILRHIAKQANIQKAHMKMGTKLSKIRAQKAWRKVLSDVDDTLTCSGGSYPAGIDKRYGKKVVYPGVLAFYRELDLGINGHEEWPANTVGNLVFLSARPHVYKDMSERRNFKKFDTLVNGAGDDGRGGMHAVPTLLAGDIASGREFVITNDFEPLAKKKFDNFKNYISIYPEFRHVFICDNGQGDVRAAQMMHQCSPSHLEALYIHKVQPIDKTYKYEPNRWKGHRNKPFFFSTYPEAALDAVTREPPLIKKSGLQRICQDAVTDFHKITTKTWPSQAHIWDRMDELNQALWRCNQFLISHNMEPSPLIEAEKIWKDGQWVCTPYGRGTVQSFCPQFDMYTIELDLRPLDEQLQEYEIRKDKEKVSNSKVDHANTIHNRRHPPDAYFIDDNAGKMMETIQEMDEESIGVDDILPPSPANRLNKDAESKLPPSNNTLNSQNNSQEYTFKPLSDSNSMSGNHKNVGSFRTFHIIPSSHCPQSNKHLSQITSYHPNKGAVSLKGRYITKFTPPFLPIFSNQDRSGFSFWGSSTDLSDGDSKKNNQIQNHNNRNSAKPSFHQETKVNTPFGPGYISAYREKDRIFTVQMINWSAHAYLRQIDVEYIDEGSGLMSLLRNFTTSDALLQSRATSSNSPKETESSILLSQDDIIQTPFGIGMVLLIPTSSNVSKHNKIESTSKPNKINSDKLLNQDTFGAIYEDISSSSSANSIVNVSLTSWTMADGTHPNLYCTQGNAYEWKRINHEGYRFKQSESIFSVFGSLVTRFISGEKKNVPVEIVIPKYKRYYQDGASVTTAYGHGRVIKFRESDGFYEVELLHWSLSRKIYQPMAYLQKDSMKCYLATGCHEGYAVLTSLGLSGILASVDARTGVHVVSIASIRCVCYLQPESIVQPLKAAVSEDVVTPFGEGKVMNYRVKDNIYEIKLTFGAVLFTSAEAFDRVEDGLVDDGSTFGMKRFLQSLFFSADDTMTIGGDQRSRSNSVTSYSIMSQQSSKTLI
eukprot:CAMPEP_0184873154 /NCGR_PEP_ID=MMETSP0580-20130426/41671_1 /TAXON_ID=1118495 /ORGANISM="Dactyliosolen fragilissimus" /LENGTH=1172 /DNA_ID=CAMNT_0027376021 /DNA_START=539 /DNA_END=4057 /DNA_ORIENTATION=-